MKKPSYLRMAGEIAIAILACEAAGIVGSLFTASAIPTWYTALTRPELSPPNWVFGPVWTTLFALMGVSVWLIWRRGTKNPDVRVALGMFAFQLMVNVLWSLAFFGLHSPGAALAVIFLLWLAIAMTIVLFAKFSKPAAWLLLPYLGWVSFATYLNYAFWILNS